MTITLKSDGTPVFISTPVGVLKIYRLKEEPRKVIVEAPPGMKQFMSETQAYEKNPFLGKLNGRVVPKFQMLVPKINEEGEFVGVASPKRLALVE